MPVWPLARGGNARSRARTADRSRARGLLMGVTALGRRSKRHAASSVASLGGCLLEVTLAPRELRGERLRANAAARIGNQCCVATTAVYMLPCAPPHVSLCCTCARLQLRARPQAPKTERMLGCMRSCVALCYAPLAAAVCRTSCRSGAWHALHGHVAQSVGRSASRRHPPARPINQWVRTMPGALRSVFGAPAVVELELVCLDGCDGPTDNLRVEVPEYCACMRACIHAPACACVRAVEGRNAAEGA